MNRPASPRRVRVGIIDSGVAPDETNQPRVVAARRFAEGGAGSIEIAPVEADAIGHGAEIARILLEDNPGVDLLIAQVFAGQRKCSTAQVAAALDWLSSCGAAVVNLSFGIRQPEAQLRLACERASAAGALLVAAAPARGAPTFPAAYPFCIAVSGDARCNKEQISWLGTAAVDFGAYPFAVPGNPQNGGASFAAARIAARIARLLGAAVAASEVRARLLEQCSFHGPERKRAGSAQDAAGVARIELQP